VQRERANFRLLQQRDERGVVPPRALLNALAAIDRQRRALTPGALERAGVPVGRRVMPERLIPETAGLNPDQSGWTSLGPTNVGGRTRSIVVHPTDANRIWLGSVGGGVWFSADGGKSFGPVDDLMANLAVTTMAMDPTNPNVIYAGTGEGFYNGDALRGGGIFRTTDGHSWAAIPSTAIPAMHYVNRLAISADGKTVLAATRSGVYRSVDAARATWTRTLTLEAADIDFAPASNTAAIVSGLNGEVFHSANGGSTWTASAHSDPWSGRVELTYARKDPTIVYASVNVSRGQIWRSSDGGKTFVRRKSVLANGNAALYLGGQGWYDNVIWAGDPTNADFVVVGGVDLWRSTDGGDTLVDISTWWSDASAHADHHVIQAHPQFNGTTNKTVFFGNDGGFYRTDDITTVGNDADPPRDAGWVRLNNTYGVTQFFGGAGNVKTGTIVGGAQDNGTLTFQTAGGPHKWTEMFGGDGGWCAADQGDPNFFYGEYVNLNIHRSSNGGQSADFISGQFWNGTAWAWRPLPHKIPDAQARAANFIAPFVLDARNTDRILGGGLELWRTENAKTPYTANPASGPTWSSIKPSTGEPISALTIAPSTSDDVWVCHNDGAVFVSHNATQPTPSWQRVDNSGTAPRPPDRFCTRLAVDPVSPATVYAAFGGYSQNNIWKTTDGGKNWKSIGATLPEAPVRAIAIHPAKPTFVYIGTEVGVFASEDGGTTWSPTNEGPTNCSVDDLFWMGNTLIAVTHGRGMFSITIPPS
jgi:photosystem II stability/assembly factor-like uncharacterized protein